MIISFIIAALSGMGVGGGGLMVVYLALFTNTPQLAAQGINLLFFLFSCGTSVCVNIAKRQILGRLILMMALFGILGSLIGTSLAGFMEESLLRKIFGGMLVVSGILSFRSSARSANKERSV